MVRLASIPLAFQRAFKTWICQPAWRSHDRMEPTSWLYDNGICSFHVLLPFVFLFKLKLVLLIVLMYFDCFIMYAAKSHYVRLNV